MRRLPYVIVALAVAVSIEMLLLIPTTRKVSQFAAEGKRARVTQCRREPVMRKVVLAGERYHLLTAGDVETFRRTAPKCP